MRLRRAFTLTACLFSLFLLFTPSAFAGKYDVVYSGGNFVRTTPYGPPQTQPYEETNGTYSSGGGYSQTTGSSGTVTADCSGEITATFKWNNEGNPDDVPPECVLIEEECGVSWSVGGTNYTNVSGDRQHGLTSDNVIVISSSTTASGSSLSVKGYKIKYNPGSGFTHTANPTANSSASCQPSFAVATAGAGVNYKARAVVLEILRDGNRLLGDNKKVLPGEQMYLTVSSGELPQSNHLWNSSGSIFGAYDDEAETVEVRPVLSYTQPAFIYYYRFGGGNQTITCSLSVAGQSVTLNAEVTVGLPTAATNAFWGGDVGFNAVPPATPTFVGLLPSSANIPGTDPPRENFGINYDCTVEVPAGFNQSALVKYTQLVCPNRTVVTTSGVSYSHIFNGQWGLDNYTPYQGAEVPLLIPLRAGDSPATGLDNLVQATIGGYPGAETFETHLMFRPGKANSQWVPLRFLVWGLTADATLTPPWTLNAAGKYKSGWNTPADHPTWERVITGEGEVTPNP